DFVNGGGEGELESSSSIIIIIIDADTSADADTYADADTNTDAHIGIEHSLVVSTVTLFHGSLARRRGGRPKLPRTGQHRLTWADESCQHQERGVRGARRARPWGRHTHKEKRWWLAERRRA
ncbi:unnamed protein product, partial [Sphacelaria rigidula]